MKQQQLLLELFQLIFKGNCTLLSSSTSPIRLYFQFRLIKFGDSGGGNTAQASAVAEVLVAAAHPRQMQLTTQAKVQPSDDTPETHHAGLFQTDGLVISDVVFYQLASSSQQFHCQPLAHLLLPAFIPLKLLPLCPVFIDLSEQPFGLSYGLVIGLHPCRRLWGAGFIWLQTCLQHNISGVSD